MRVFVTGATGFVGSAVVDDLSAAGHRVLGLARSDGSAAALEAAGAEVHRGSLDDLESLRRGAAASDGVIHTAFVHDFGDFAEAAKTDLRAVEAMGEALAGTGRPFVVTSGASVLGLDRTATEDDAQAAAWPRAASEDAVLDLAARGVRASVVRLPQVHGAPYRHGFVPGMIDVAREKGVSAYVGDGANRWSAVHVLDAARLYRLALESAPAGARLHAVADEGVPIRDIAEVIGRKLDLPTVSVSAEDAPGHFGWVAFLIAMDGPSSSASTRQRMGWHPEQPGLLADLEDGYFRGRRLSR